MITPSMRCTKEEDHVYDPTNDSHTSIGTWLEVVEITEYAIGQLRRLGRENSAQYLENHLRKFGL